MPECSTSTRYDSPPYIIRDNCDDLIVSRGEVRIQDGAGVRGLNDSEWKKFNQSNYSITKRAIMLFGGDENSPRHPLLIVNKDRMSGDDILKMLETNPLVLKDIVREIGGVGYLILELEYYLNKPPPAKFVEAKAELARWEAEFTRWYDLVKAFPANEQKKLVTPLMANFRDFKDEELSALIKILSVSHFIFGAKKIGYSFEATLHDALLNAKTDCDRYAALYVHLGQMMGWSFRLYKFNNHVAVIFLDEKLAGGRIVIEPTDGLPTDPKTYQEDDRITCLRLGMPVSAFERGPEGAVVSVLVQRANDILDGNLKEKHDEAKRLLVLSDRLQPDDPNILLLLGDVSGRMGDNKAAEEYSQRFTNLIQRHIKAK